MHERGGEQFLAQQVDQRHDLLAAHRIDPGTEGARTQVQPVAAQILTHSVNRQPQIELGFDDVRE